ncbi:hypothetical protein D6821_00345 [Candidatus Parcubacteria bacterium]|nr:MAG: hypothetical protein D6821_00345 [Candidatus Parcubacteria bacterium]
MFVIALVSVPFGFMAIISLTLLGSMSGFWFFALIFIVLAFVLTVWTGALLTVFQISAWIDLYLILINRGAVSRLVKFSSELLGRGKKIKEV